MKANELKKGKIYKDIADKRVPLMFTGKKVKRYDIGCEYFLCYFTTVKTNDNKNWYQKRTKTITLYNDVKIDRISEI